MIGAIFVLVAALIALNAAKSELIKDDNGEYKHPLAGVIVSGVLYLVGYFMLIKWTTGHMFGGLIVFLTALAALIVAMSLAKNTTPVVTQDNTQPESEEVQPETEVEAEPKETVVDAETETPESNEETKE